MLEVRNGASFDLLVFLECLDTIVLCMPGLVSMLHLPHDYVRYNHGPGRTAFPLPGIVDRAQPCFHSQKPTLASCPHFHCQSHCSCITGVTLVSHVHGLLLAVPHV